MKYQSTLCPQPWRVPTQDDLVAVASNTNRTQIIANFGAHGWMDGTSQAFASLLFFWSTWESPANGDNAYIFNASLNPATHLWSKKDLFEVHCVK
jgi:hypothetical protein